MGKTVAELERDLSLTELYEWEAFNEVEPFGTPAEDDRWRQFYALFYAANSSAGSEQPDWLDRMPEETARLRAKIDAQTTVEDKIMAFFGAPSVEPVEVEWVIIDGVITSVPVTQPSGEEACTPDHSLEDHTGHLTEG